METTMSKETDAPRRRLGRGLSSLLGGGPVAIEVGSPTSPPSPAPADVPPPAPGVSMLAVSSIVPNPAQPRRRFADNGMAQLVESIKSAGIVQPVIVRHASSGGVG